MSKCLELIEEINNLREENEHLKLELREQTYKGNSIGYIYDKMIAYKRYIDKLKWENGGRVSVNSWAHGTDKHKKQ